LAKIQGVEFNRILLFDFEKLSLEPIKSDEEYKRLRLKIPVRLEQARQMVQIDLNLRSAVLKHICMKNQMKRFCLQ